MKFGPTIVALLAAAACLAALGYYSSPERMIAVTEEVSNFDEEGNFFYKNPFEIDKQMTVGAKAVIPEDSYDFGRMALGQRGTHDYVIRNEGTVALKLAKGRAMCKCTLANLNNAELAPGEETTIKLEYEPKSTGPFSQNAVIWTSDPDKPEIQLAVSGEMFNEVIISPSEGWNLGTLSKNEAPFDGFVVSQIHKDLEILEWNSSSDLVKVQVERMDVVDVPIPDCKSAYRVTGTVTPPESAGPIREQIILKTNQEGEFAEIKLGIAATRLGPITIVGPGWYGEKSIFNLERVDAHKGKTSRYSISLEGNYDDLQLTSVESSPAGVEATLTKVKASDSLSRYTLTLRVPPDTIRPGSWTLPGSPGTLTLKTNHPSLAELQFSLQMEVR